MFTIKYIYPTGQEMISGPYETVNAEWVDRDGNHVDPASPPIEQPIYQVVYAYEGRLKPDDARTARPDISVGANMTFGPNIPPPSETPAARPRGRVYVMNETGATVAKYEL
jgi:hypothetical protein